jgi:LuxR family maltose regulon positive regulatory protein
VADGVLRVLDPSGEPEIAVASPSWIAWLTDPATRSFSFQSPRCRYTARKEYRSRGGEYWIAYRKKGGKLHKAYLGKAEDVTLARLEDVAAVMADRGGEVAASPPSDEASGDGGPSTRVDAATTDSHTTVDDQLRERRGHSTSTDPLLMTKLAVPSTRVSLVPRPRLSERLEEGLGPQLNLVSAPAGFGKSALRGTWASELSGSGRLMAWYSLDSGDNDPAQFWRYFFTAVDLLQPGSGKAALGLLGSPQAPPIEAILTTLLNELVDLSTDAVLVVDDYHLIEFQTIHEALTFLIDHLPPRMSLVIATLMDPPLPLPRMRARGEMTELRAADLRFTPRRQQRSSTRLWASSSLLKLLPSWRDVSRAG